MTSIPKLPLLSMPNDELEYPAHMAAKPVLTPAQRKQTRIIAEKLVKEARAHGDVGPTERLMAVYNLSTEEGRALMELVEALLRVPDTYTRDALIHDKIVGHHWLAGDADTLAQAAGLALTTAGVIMKDDSSSILHTMAHRLGMPVIRASILAGMRLLGQQFVFAQTIEEAVVKAGKNTETKYSFDMLGEGARTESDALRYLAAYEKAIKVVSEAATETEADKCHANDGVSVKLSALYCRYRTRYWPDVYKVLVPRIVHLAELAQAGNIPLTIDAEESVRLEMMLGIVEALIKNTQLQQWHGLGVVVQGYNMRSWPLLDKLFALAAACDRRFAIRLVKGAYWDAEIKIAQEKGQYLFPVFTRKSHTDLAYLEHASKLLQQENHRIYPQFATHNATTLAALETMFKQLDHEDFEVQRLHGMGEAIHATYNKNYGRCARVYAPVGSHNDLLAYLVRRLLENAANASFLHKMNDPDTPLAELACDPYDIDTVAGNHSLRKGCDLFVPERANSQGWDLDNPATLAELKEKRPSDTNIKLLSAPQQATRQDVQAAFKAAQAAQSDWLKSDRVAIFNQVADNFERNSHELLSLLTDEAGKTIDDAVAELREAVDFCRYYAQVARQLPKDTQARGTVLAISPWNFPLAIFTGQVAAALLAGNTVIAKPAEQTPRIAQFAVKLMYEAGVAVAALHLLAGDGETLGAQLTAYGQADMVVFTGSTATAQHIHRSIAHSAKLLAPLLAETGGLNAMIVDSTALLERVVDDVIASAFRSAGQRCSSLRMLYVQEEKYKSLLAMLVGAAEALKLGDPLDQSVDVGPVIDGAAQEAINTYVSAANEKGKLIWQGSIPDAGLFCAPAIIKVNSIVDLDQEVFGPVLHIASYQAGKEKDVIADINSRGYGLTLGIHSRIVRYQHELAAQAQVGNVYINRNQVGAIVGSQPFGGHGLSGTGPKAGGPLYVRAFTTTARPDPKVLAPDGLLLPGPDGEENLYRTAACETIKFSDIQDDKSKFKSGTVIDARGVATEKVAALRKKICELPGPLTNFITDAGSEAWLYREYHRCTDLTAMGGNTEILTGE